MKKILALLCCLVAPAAGVVAQAVKPAAPAAGKMLLLQNGRTLEGDIERVGEQYRVRRAGGETWVPAGAALRLCADRLDAYQFLRGRTNLDDADERLRLARWCHDNQLPRQAVEEAIAAARLRPAHPETQRLLDGYQRLAAADRPPPLMPPAEAEAPAPPPVDLTAEALGQFTTRVQPILMNACVGCHSAGHAGTFQLARAGDAAALSRKVLQQNLAAVLAQVNVAQPHASPLLTRAVSVHGGVNQAPLKGRQAVAYRALEDWVKATLANNPQLRERLAGPAPAPANEAKNVFASAQPGAPHAEDTPAPPLPPPPAEREIIKPAAPAKPAPAPDDPFDPDFFNRQTHPERDKPPAPKP